MPIVLVIPLALAAIFWSFLGIYIFLSTIIALLKFVFNFLKLIVQILYNVGLLLLDSMKTLGNMALSLCKMAVNILYEAASGLFDLMKFVSEKIFDFSKEFLKLAFEFVRNVGELFTPVIAFFSNGLNTISSYLEACSDIIQRSFSHFFSKNNTSHSFNDQESSESSKHAEYLNDHKEISQIFKPGVLFGTSSRTNDFMAAVADWISLFIVSSFRSGAKPSEPSAPPYENLVNNHNNIPIAIARPMNNSDIPEAQVLTNPYKQNNS